MWHRLYTTAFVVVALTTSTASAAPALVWNAADRSRSTTYASDPVDTSALLDGVSVVFVLGRTTHGDDWLTQLAPTLLSDDTDSSSSRSNHNNNDNHNYPTTIYSHSSGAIPASSRTVQHGSLGDVARKFNATSSLDIDVLPHRTVRQLTRADTLVVALDHDDTGLADAVRLARAHADTVVLTAQRSVQEIRQERLARAHRRLDIQRKAGRHLTTTPTNKSDGRHRRLEDQGDNNENNNGDNNNQDLSGVYYVSLTPNIFAGILFFLLFATVIWIGIGCLGAIQGQDCYVKKLPAIGREA